MPGGGLSRSCKRDEAFLIYGFHPIQRWHYRRLPGPPAYWLVGNLPELARKGMHVAYQDWQRQYGPVFKVMMGGTVAVVVGRPVSVRKVARCSAWRQGIKLLAVGKEKKILGYSIITSRGDMWRMTSNAWHPFFAKDSLAGYQPLMVQSADRLVDVLGAYADSGREVDIWRQFGALALDVVGTTAFGVDFCTLESLRAAAPADAPPPASHPAANGLAKGLEPSTHGDKRAHAGTSAAAELKQKGVETTAEQLVDAVRATFDAFEMNVWTALSFLFPGLEFLLSVAATCLPTAKARKAKKARATMHSLGAQLLSSFRASAAAGEKPAAVATGSKGVDPGSFLALQARAVNKSTGQPFPDEWIIQQGSIFIGGGYETSANALAASVYLLSANPDKEAKMLAEIDAFGRDKAPSIGDLKSFPYVDAVWREALRLYPPGIINGREAQHDVWLEGYHLPKGTTLHGNVWYMHRDPANWRDPEAFIPERFLPGAPEAEGVNMDAWMPFGDGARRCIGYQFATQEGLLTLIRLYQKLVFHLTPGQIPLKVKVNLALGPAEGVRVMVHRRE